MDHARTVAALGDSTDGREQSAGGRHKPRVALYSHDTMGIGHMRRNLLLAQVLAGGPSPASVLLIAGAREINSFSVATGVDCLSLPALSKEGNGQYRARQLDLTLAELIALRARSIAAALEAFRPDVFVADKVPRGAVNELDLALQWLLSQRRTRCVLGLRDVLDDPATVRREWAESGNEQVIADHYDAVWVYGDPTVYDPVREYGFAPEVAAKVRYTGYLDQRQRTRLADFEVHSAPPLAADTSPDRLVLCLIGGGQDGGPLAEAFARASFPPGWTGVILTGPFLPPEALCTLRQLAAGNPRLRVLPFVTDTDLLLEQADRVIAMGGYNTICEVLSFEKPALIVPRVWPRREQLIRAERLRDLGLLDLLPPEELSPGALTGWLGAARPSPRAHGKVNLDGLANLPRLLDELIAAPPRWESARPERRWNHVVR
jgi:predicted glycosyltransferase